MVLVATSQPAPVDSNPGWQKLNKALGVVLVVNMVPQSDYASRLGSVTTSHSYQPNSNLPAISWTPLRGDSS